MKLNQSLSALLAGAAIAPTLILSLSTAAVAQTVKKVGDVAREVTVLIRRDRGPEGLRVASGAIVARDGNTYAVLTAGHAVRQAGEYQVRTEDKQTYAVGRDRITILPGVDLAIIEFSSDRPYPVAKLANSDAADVGQTVFVVGWVVLGDIDRGGQFVRQIADGGISGFLDAPWEGYRISYTNVTSPGMNGGPVFDLGGRIIAMHGFGDNQDPARLGIGTSAPATTQPIKYDRRSDFGFAIPINTFLQQAAQAKLNLNLQVDNSPAPALSSASGVSFEF